MDNDKILSISEIMKNKISKKAPAYPWQDLALRIIKELGIPGFKRNSVFKVCKNYPIAIVERCLIDTKELCQKGDKWKYFFKIIEKKPE